MPKLLKKIFLSFFVCLYLFSFSFSLFVPKVKAAEENPWYWQNFPQWYVKVYDTSNEAEIFGERYTAAQVLWVAYAIPGYALTEMFGPKFVLCMFSGDFMQCLTSAPEIIDDIKSKIEALDNLFGSAEDENALNSTNENFSFINFFYKQPVSGIGYVLKTGERLKIIPEARAQGFGFNTGATPVQELWKLTRDVSYFFLILIILVIAFMIMFRVKISPQAVITIQSALPKIVITIILITFSFAIAGFLIDLMYVVIGLFSSIVGAKGAAETGLSDFTPTQMFNALTDSKTAFSLTWQYAIAFFFAIIPVAIQSKISGILVFVLAIWVLIISIWYSIKTTWMLIKTFVNIMLLIITAPLEILFGAVSQGSGFGSWVNKMATNLAVYPVVGILFFISFVFLKGALNEVSGPNFFQGGTDWFMPFNINPILSSNAWQPPLTFGTASAKFIWALASFGVFVIIPKTAQLIKSVMERKPFDFETAIGEAAGPPKMVGTYAAAEIMNWRDRSAKGSGLPTPAWIQSLRKYLGIKA